MENNKEIEKAAALALLDRGIAFRLPAPWLLRLFGKKNIKITVKRIRLGALVHLSTLEEMAPLERMELDEDRAKIVADADAEPMTLPYRVIVTRTPAITREVAALLLNSHVKIKLFQKPLARYLRWAIHPDQLQELVMWLFVYGRAEAFTNTTKFLRKMMMTNPMNLGQN